MRLRGLLAALLVSLALPASALALAPGNDLVATPQGITPAYQPSVNTITIPPDGPAGGWVDATSTGDTLLPSCLGSAGTHSMWYLLTVADPSVLTVSLASGDASLYRPLITIINADTMTEAACSLAGPAIAANQAVTASTYVGSGNYWIRIASGLLFPAPGDDEPLPSLTLTESLRDVTPPQIRVAVSDIVGIGKSFTFDASASTDGGSGLDPASANWSFYDAGAVKMVPAAALANPLVAKHAWRTAGLHRVTLQLADLNGNRNTYSFNVLVHSFVPPKVSVRVLKPAVGARSLRILLTHDQPVRVRLVVLQSGVVLRAIPAKIIKGFRTTTSVTIALKKRVARGSYVVVTGTASDVSTNPNTVALRTCSVLPGKGGGVCA